jgi:TonB family protein
MTRPQLIQYGTPTYTAEARRQGIEGVVTFQVEFDIDGNFKVLRIVKGLGFGLDEQALEALKTYRFTPAYRSGYGL